MGGTIINIRGTENDHNDNASTDKRDEDLSDENDRTDVIEEETVIPSQCCDVPSPTSSQPVQKTRTRVIKPPVHYSSAQGELFKAQGDVTVINN